MSHDLLQKIYSNLGPKARTYKNKFYENEIKFNLLNLLKKVSLQYNWQTGGVGVQPSPPPPVPDSLKDQ